MLAVVVADLLAVALLELALGQTAVVMVVGQLLLQMYLQILDPQILVVAVVERR
jgi:hypothetical protein